MNFREQLEADLANVFLNPDEFGEQITYMPRGSAALSCLAIVTSTSDLVQQSHVRAQLTTVDVVLQQSDVPAPGEGDQLEYLGRKFAFVTIVSQQASAWRLRFHSASARETGRR